MLFFLKKSITPFLLPPGIFIVVFLVSGWILGGKKNKAAWLCLGMAGFIWIFSVGPTADFLMRRLEAGFPIPNNPKADVIIMLGGSTFDKAPDLSGIGAPGPGTMERMVTAARLQRRLGVPILASGGNVFAHDGSSARLAKRFLVDLGIDDEKIIVEDRSRDTFENARYSKAICDHYGFKAPVLVTSGYHLKRAMHCFNQVGLKVVPFPCGLTTWPHKELTWRSFLPNAASLETTAEALHEWLGLLFYQIAPSS
ncbi:MAG: YdcF family protein [Desulfobacteraceae bacterium]|nr:YdcF family protein [Desulfobacteraceae bacterium]